MAHDWLWNAGKEAKNLIGREINMLKDGPDPVRKLSEKAWDTAIKAGKNVRKNQAQKNKAIAKRKAEEELTRQRRRGTSAPYGSI